MNYFEYLKPNWKNLGCTLLLMLLAYMGPSPLFLINQNLFGTGLNNDFLRFVIQVIASYLISCLFNYFFTKFYPNDKNPLNDKF